MADEIRQLYDKLSPAELASLPPELRGEIAAQSRDRSGAKAEARRMAAALEAAQRVPPHRRDMTPVKVYVQAKNSPVGLVFSEVEEEVTVAGVELIKVADGVDKKGDEKFKAVEVKTYRQEMQKVAKLIERPLEYKERVIMPKWIVDLMAGNDHVVILE